MSNNLEYIIIKTLEEIRKQGIHVVINKNERSAKAILPTRTIVLPEISYTPLCYYRLKHEYYHLVYFPKDSCIRSEILSLVAEDEGIEFVEEELVLYTAFGIVSNAIVNRYGFKYDQHRRLFMEGHWQSIDRMREDVSDKVVKVYLYMLTIVPHNIEGMSIEKIADYVSLAYRLLRKL